MTAPVVTSNLDAALRCAALRWRVFPVWHPNGSGCACGASDCGSPAKHPITPHGFKDATNYEDPIRRWWTAQPGANIGLATGMMSGLVVLDIDPRNGGDESLARLVAIHGPLPETVESHTGGGGRHLFFKHASSMVSGVIAPGLDRKADGGYIVVPPSRHISGGTYAWMPGRTPWDVTLAEFPPCLMDRERKENRHTQPTESAIREGNRHATLVSLAGSLAKRITGPALVGALQGVNEAICDPPTSVDEVHKIAEWATAREESKSGSPSTTEVTGIDFPIVEVDLVRFALDGIPKPDFILSSWLMRRDIALIAGGGGIGKSTLAADLGHTLAERRPWLGIEPDRAYRVGVVDDEQSDEQSARLHLRLCGGMPSPNLFLASCQIVRLDSDEGAARLEAWVVRRELEILVIDGTQQAFGTIDRKDASQVSVVFGRLFRIRDRQRATIVMLAPKRKDFEGRPSGARLESVLDSVAFGNLSDTVWFCTPGGPNSMNVEQVKRRGGTKTSIVVGYREEGDRIVLSGGGPVENAETALAGCVKWIVAFLEEKATLVKRAEIIEAANRTETPSSAKTVDDALALLVKTRGVTRVKTGWYEARRQADGGHRDE